MAIKHPNKEINAAIEYALSKQWEIKVGGGHCWGKMYCPFNDEECRCGEFCVTSIWSTPRSPENHARALRRVVDKCVGKVDEDVTNTMPKVKKIGE